MSITDKDSNEPKHQKTQQGAQTRLPEFEYNTDDPTKQHESGGFTGITPSAQIPLYGNRPGFGFGRYGDQSPRPPTAEERAHFNDLQQSVQRYPQGRYVSNPFAGALAATSEEELREIAVIEEIFATYLGEFSSTNLEDKGITTSDGIAEYPINTAINFVRQLREMVIRQTIHHLNNRPNSGDSFFEQRMFPRLVAKRTYEIEVAVKENKMQFIPLFQYEMKLMHNFPEYMSNPQYGNVAPYLQKILVGAWTQRSDGWEHTLVLPEPEELVNLIISQVNNNNPMFINPRSF